MGADDLLTVLNHEILFHTTGKVLNLTDLEAQDAITSLCMANHYKVVVLDNLSCLFSGMKENDGDAWEAVLGWLLTLRRRRIAVVIVHHAGKNGSMRGTSRREDAAHWVIKLDPVGEREGDLKRETRFISRGDKDRNAPIETLEWRFQTSDNGNVLITFKKADSMELLLQWVADDINTATGIAAEMGISPGQVSKLAKKAIEAGRLKKNGRVYVLV